MTQKEKAKAYDEVLNKLRRFIAQGVDPLITRADVQDFFPELIESEDERISKEIITYLSTAEDKELIPYESWINWLEKQGEQKPAWSEEDERIYKVILDLMDAYSKGTIGGYIISPNTDRYIKWFKSIKDRFTWKPSDEQMITLRHVISGCSYDIDPLVELETKLKEL